MANTTIVGDPGQLTRGDLVDEYERLSTAYRRLQRTEEQQLQQIHELKRTMQTVSHAETHLAAELEYLAGGHEAELQQLQQRHRGELDDVRSKLADALEANAAADAEHEQLRATVAELRKTIDDLQLAGDEPKADPKRDAQAAASLASAQLDNDRLLETLAGERQRLGDALKQVLQLERTVEDMRDHLECTETTLQNKRDELEAKALDHEADQERIMQLSDELSALRKEPAADTEKRGNSLFAEVDDQRQHMRHVLAAQKKHYVQMKQDYGQSQQKIRALKRENASMNKELKICGTMFLDADQTFKVKLNDRIRNLLNEIQHLETKVNFTESKLLSVANDQGVSWLDSMLTFCKNESIMYKNQLHQCRVQKASAEEALNNAELDLARWRFEALKLRCTIIHREELLTDSGIAFEADPPQVVQQARKLCAEDVRPSTVVRPSTIDAPSVDAAIKLEANVSGEDKENRGSPAVEAAIKREANVSGEDKENRCATVIGPVKIEPAVDRVEVESSNITIEATVTPDTSIKSETTETTETPPIVCKRSPADPHQSPAPLAQRPVTTSADNRPAIRTPESTATTTKKVTISFHTDIKTALPPAAMAPVRPTILVTQKSAQPPTIAVDVPKPVVSGPAPTKLRHVIVKSKKPTMFPQ